MFLRRSFEMVTFVGYWCVLIPLLYSYLKKKEIIKFALDDLLNSIVNHAMYFLGATVVFMFIHRIAIWLYYLLKLSDKKMALNLRNMDKIATNQETEETKPSIWRRIFHLKRKENEDKSLRNNVEQGVPSKDSKECDTIVEIRRNKPTTNILEKKINNKNKIAQDIENQQVFEKRSSRLLHILNGIRRYSSNQKNNTNLIEVHQPITSNIKQKPLNVKHLRRAPGIPGTGSMVASLDRNIARKPFQKANSEDIAYSFKRNLALSSTSLSGSVDTNSLLRPSNLKKTYTNPNLISNNPDWV